MIWNLIGSIGGKVLDIVDDVVEDKDEANRLKFEVQGQLIENKSSETGSCREDSLGRGPRLMASTQNDLYVNFLNFQPERSFKLTEL